MMQENYRQQLLKCLDMCIIALNNIKQSSLKDDLGTAINNVDLCIKHFPDIKRKLLFFNNIRKPLIDHIVLTSKEPPKDIG